MSEERLYLWKKTRGKSDKEILELVDLLGRPTNFLNIVMNFLPFELDPETATDCVIGFEVSTADRVHNLRVEITGDKCVAERREPKGADTTIAISLPNFVRLITDELGGVKAFMQGKLWVRGNPTFAYSIPKMFPFREKEAVS
jgi:putative sterol carrier protein